MVSRLLYTQKQDCGVSSPFEGLVVRSHSLRHRTLSFSPKEQLSDVSQLVSATLCCILWDRGPASGHVFPSLSPSWVDAIFPHPPEAETG